MSEIIENIDTRPYTQSDFHAVVNLLKMSGIFIDSDIRENFDIISQITPGALIVAESESKIIGFLSLLKTSEAVMIDKLVPLSKEGILIRSALLSLAKNIAIENSYTELLLRLPNNAAIEQAELDSYSDEETGFEIY